MPRQFKVRMAVEVPEATSENMAAWIEQALEKGEKLAPDPGAGPALLTFSLDPAKLIELANRKRERAHVILRRLIATRVTLPDRAKEKPEKPAGATAAELLPEKVLPAKLSYTAEDMLSIVKTLDSGMALAYRRVYGLKKLEPAKTPEADRELAGAMAECANRRSPAWMLANADLIKLTMSSFRWGFAQTEQLDKATEEERERRKNGHAPQPAAVAPVVKKEQPAATAEEIPADLADHIHEPLQAEGEF